MVSENISLSLEAMLANELTGSTLSVQLAELSHSRYRMGWMSMEEIAGGIFRLRDIESSHVKNLVASMRALAFYYGNEMTTVTGL